MTYPLPMISAQLLDRYLSGECTPRESMLVETWLAARPEYEHTALRFRGIGFESRVQDPPDSQGAWMRFDRRHPVETPASVKSETAGMAGSATVKKLFRVWPQRRLVPHAFRRAAGLGVALGAVILVGGLGLYTAHRWMSIARHDVEILLPPTMVATERGQRASIQLPDGSRVTLGVESRIRYARDFGRLSREVTLEGEAYFDVVHDARVPFRVRTVHGLSEDVGTRFAVRAYTGETSTRVIVEEGRVAVGHGVTLAAGDLARLTSSAPPVVRHDAPVQELLAWRQGQLRFTNVPLRDVLADVRRWYDVDVQLGDSTLGEEAVTASFGKKPLSQVLESLARVVDARLERHGARWVFVSPRHPVMQNRTSTDHHFPQGATHAQ